MRDILEQLIAGPNSIEPNKIMEMEWFLKSWAWRVDSLLTPYDIEKSNNSIALQLHELRMSIWWISLEDRWFPDLLLDSNTTYTEILSQLLPYHQIKEHIEHPIDLNNKVMFPWLQGFVWQYDGYQ